MGTELTKQDRCDWNFHKAVCKRNKDSVIDTAKSLKAIRDRKLWRAQYESFEAFAADIYGRSLRWANAFILGEIGASVKADSSPNGVDAARTDPALEASSEGVSAGIAKSGPNTTKNADSATDAIENTVSTPGPVTEAASHGQPKPPKPSATDPFKKLDDLIGKAIRATDDIGKGSHHDVILDILGQLLNEVKRWRAAA